jgi:nitroreductase
MLLASYGFGIGLKPRIDKGNFILRPTFSLALLARVSAPSNGNMQRWRFLVIRDAKIKEIVGSTTREPGTSRLRRGIGLVNPLLA